MNKAGGLLDHRTALDLMSTNNFYLIKVKYLRLNEQ